MPEFARNVDHDAAAPICTNTNTYYHKLIDWDNADDPLRKLLSPALPKTGGKGVWGASDEEAEYLAQGYRHKFRASAFLMLPETEAEEGVTPALEYIASHPEIRQVILAGGDCFSLPTAKLRKLIESLRAIPHVGIIRLSTRTPVMDPVRISEDRGLLRLIREYSTPAKPIYLMVHVHHPREMTAEATRSLRSLRDAGAVIVNRTPILGGINDAPELLGELLELLELAGVTPYYFFVDRPRDDDCQFAVPLAKAYRLVEQAKLTTAGLGRRARLAVNHDAGFIEVLAVESGKAYLKFHASPDDEAGKFITADCPEDALWLNDLPGSESRIGSVQIDWTDSEDYGLHTSYVKRPYQIGD
ncbi:KamA family radical SAM protein [Cohnella rhizoplanae]|uniref:KamA family radical SAM protein n=1 Tax=Cohnella rhizoplanae TaxID=2974897 RepID=UPI003D7C2434